MLRHLDSDIDVDWATLVVNKPHGFYVAVECIDNNQLPPYRLVIRPIAMKDSKNVHNYFESVPDIFKKFEICQSNVNGGPIELEHWAKVHGFGVDEFVEMMEELYQNTLEQNPEQLV